MRILLGFLLLYLLHINLIDSKTLQDEQKVLLSIKFAITDDPQNTLSSWNTTTNHCTWPFVTCSHSPTSTGTSTVISLDISGLNLTGNLSLSNISILTNLQKVSVADNYFSGPIPPSILSNLHYLNLSDNIFNGTFPSLSSFNRLTILDVYNNYLTGSLPLSVINMTKFPR
ncbi:hypothetical protein BVRB_5g102610 [Beta vulgaris subsp. vulgaris]|nr:hypothetical protein BVRB_5g102610 [Beta vulgaris subsp. vulgaris]